MKLSSVLIQGGLLAAGVYAGSCELTPEKVEQDISRNRLEKTLRRLDRIASDNGGNRAFGLPGYKASLDLILEHVQGRYAKSLNTVVQSFNYTFESTRDIWLKGPDGEKVSVLTLTYNIPTALPGGVTAALVNIPVDDERGTGCFADQWAGIDATGKIALVKRGVCAVSDKLKLAKAAGAKAVIMYNNSPGARIGGAILGPENMGLIVPVGVITLEVGTAWKDRLEKGESLTVTLLVDSFSDERETWNVISETKEGDPNNVVMLGAHLDSVQGGPGVNDNGSGVAGLLEIVNSIVKYGGFKNKVRFAWWAGEENLMFGSHYYGSSLTPEEADKIRFYFNYDMIGSPHPEYIVYADSDAHKSGGSIIFDYLKKIGKAPTYGNFGVTSDYVPFLDLGIPCSGLFTGSDEKADPCYHSKCDTIDNIDFDALVISTKAAGRAAAQLALSLDGVPPRNTTSPNPKSK